MDDGPSGDAAGVRSLSVSLAANANDCVVAMSGMADGPGSGSANMLVALCKCQLLLLVLGEGTAFLQPVMHKPQTRTSFGARVLV